MRTGSGSTPGWAAIARPAAAALLVTATTVAFTPAAHAATTLLSAADPLAGSTTAIILGGTTEPTPSAQFARTAEELYLHPLGFDHGATDSTVCQMDGTDPCSAPLQVLTTPELVQQAPSSETAASAITLAVEHEFAAHPGEFDAEHPLVVFGYSQSATAESLAMASLHADGIPTDAVHFVFIGDPSTPDGIWAGLRPAMEDALGKQLADEVLDRFGISGIFGSQTPTDLYPTTIYSLDDDPVPNFHDVYEEKGVWGALLDVLGPHVEYLGLTPEQVADSTVTVDGQVTNIDIHTDDINGLEAWLDSVFVGGAANSGLLTSVVDSLELLLFNTY